MALIKLTFDGANNTAKMDADINAFLTSYQSGIVSGVGNSLNYSIANGKITFSSGLVSVYGRRVYVEDGTPIDISLDSAKYGYVIMQIDTSSNDVKMIKRESSTIDIPLTQNNLLKGDGVYEFVMCAYYKTTSSLVTNNNFTRRFISTNKQDIAALDTSIENKFRYRYIKRYSKVGAVNKFSLDSVNYLDSLIVVTINYKVTLIIPGTMIGVRSSVTSMDYTIGGNFYSLLVERGADNYLYLTTGLTSHNIPIIYIFK